MKKTKFTFLLIFLSAYFTNAQTLNWVKSWGSPSTFANDLGYGVVVDGAGNVYSTGLYSGTIDFDPGAGTYTLSSNAGSTDIFISKLDAAGNFIWAVSMGGTGSGEAGYAITLDPTGNVCVTGYYQGTPDFDPGAGTFTMTAAAQSDIFVLKLSAAGNFIWAKSFGGFTGDYGHGIKTDASGNIYIAGGYQGAYISKLDASGNIVWAHTISNTLARSLDLDASGNVLVTGEFTGTIDFDPGAGTYTLTSGGMEDAFVLKLNSSGNFVWAKNLSGTDRSYGYCVTADVSGNVYSTGRFKAVTDFDPGAGTFTLTPTGQEDIYISKLDASGNFVWAKKIGAGLPDFGYSIVADALGNIYLSGTFQGTADFDPGAGTFNLSSAGGMDLFICNLDAAGNFLWAGNMGSSTNDYCFGLTVDMSNNIYATGYFAGTCDFDPNSGTFNLISNGGVDAFVIKLNALGTSLSESNLNDHLISVYPNPSSGEFTIRFKNNSDATVEVIDLLGQIVYSEKIVSTNKQLNLNLTNGIYSIRISENGKTSTTKFIIQK
ncbi:MAG: T9SS type A sorting domain-containing protein [Bacteroidia bacterium]|nr:T9SS type A sorting domain-containing protein [Bacteroidia bacterium]